MTCKNYGKGNQFYSTLSVESVHLMQTELPSMIVMSEKKNTSLIIVKATQAIYMTVIRAIEGYQHGVLGY